jgi:hypothetical protein
MGAQAAAASEQPQPHSSHVIHAAAGGQGVATGPILALVAGSEDVIDRHSQRYYQQQQVQPHGEVDQRNVALVAAEEGAAAGGTAAHSSR